MALCANEKCAWGRLGSANMELCWRYEIWDMEARIEKPT